MSPQSFPDPDASGDAKAPGEANWLDEDWDDADEADGLCPARPGGSPPWSALPARYDGRPGEPPRSGMRRGLVVAAVAVVAAAVGAGVTVGVSGAFSSSADAGAPPSSSPAVPAPGAGSGNGFLPSGAGGGSGAGEQMLAAGKVTAINSTSITVSGGGNSITAAITRSTEFTGSVKSASGIKIGDLVMLDVSVNGSTSTVTSIQEPLRGNGSLP